MGHSDRYSMESYLEKPRDVERDAMDFYEKESRKGAGHFHTWIAHNKTGCDLVAATR